MTDIVERLLGKTDDDFAPRPVSAIRREAADEIERLRAALREVITTDPATDPPEASSDWYQEWKGLAFRLKGIARRALEGEPTDAQLARYHGDVDGDAAL